MTALSVDAHQPRAFATLAWLRERGMGASILVAGISAAFGVVLLSATGYIAALMRADPYIGETETAGAVLAIMTVLLVGVAVYVAAIVTANTFATIIAGRTRRIALLRLIGASARAQRAEVARQGLVVGVIGAAAGLIGGILVSIGGIAVLAQTLGLPDVGYSVLQPVILFPAAVVVFTTWAAAWAGSRPVLVVTPLQALGGAVEATREDAAGRRGIGAIVLLVLGGLLLAGGILAGIVTPLGVIIAFFGGLVSFTGLVFGATFFMPPALRLVGGLFGRSATARLAAENALRYPVRSSRMAIGVVMGVALVTMFAVASESAKAVLAKTAGGELPPELASMMDGLAGIMMGLVAVAAVIAAVGLVNLLTIGVVQRTRELGLLRALGLSSGQVRTVVLLEAVHVTITALVVGLTLGILYGWAGAQSLLGSVPVVFGGPRGTLVLPAVPLWAVLIVVGATALLTLVAAVVPTRLATRVAPVEALAE